MASGLRAWHGFACGVLKYEDQASLPPRSEAHVLWYLQIFRNGGTAQNYLHYLRWACGELKLDVSWDTDTVRAAVQGTKKMGLRLLGGTRHQQTLLTAKSLTTCVAAADALGETRWAVCALVIWDCLLRVQSEGISLQIGSAKQIVDLTVGRHSAVYVDGKRSVHVRLARRKHRPSGTTLHRKCRCTVTGPQFCAPCRVLGLVDALHLQDGDRIYSGSAFDFRSTLRRLLVLAGVHRAETYTLKCSAVGAPQK